MIFCDGNSRNLSNAIYCKHINYPLFERDQLDWATYWMYWLSIKEEMSPEGSRLESWISVVVVKLLIRPCFNWARISSVWRLIPCLWTGGSCTSGLYSGSGKASSSSFVMTAMFMAIKFTHSLLLLILWVIVLELVTAWAALPLEDSASQSLTPSRIFVMLTLDRVCWLTLPLNQLEVNDCISVKNNIKIDLMFDPTYWVFNIGYVINMSA